MTEFQKRVYKAVEQIPKSRVVTYGEVTRMAGSPRASRAVGNILHKNPFFGVVPCHRVVHADGAHHKFNKSFIKRCAKFS